MKNAVICRPMRSNGKKRMLSLLITVLVIISLIAVPISSSAASGVQSSISSSQVASGSDSCTHPGDIKELISGSTYYFNLDGNPECKFKTARLYVRQANERSYNCVYAYNSKKSFSSVSKLLEVDGTGTLQYYWKVKYADVNRTETFRTVRRTVVSRKDISKNSIEWHDSMMESCWSDMISNW